MALKRPGDRVAASLMVACTPRIHASSRAAVSLPIHASSRVAMVTCGSIKAPYKWQLGIPRSRARSSNLPVLPLLLVAAARCFTVHSSHHQSGIKTHTACCLSCFHPQAATPTQCLVKPTYSLTASCCYSRQGWNQNLRLFLGAISKLAG
ncbi:hypothetical protein BDA96_07G238600 [Sorghum bicolor]|uniref:Uncharacterized protein n=2 Tax=Sorghum bicolor TaxID=4558 RepID=A0A921QQV3_SORBI|nr:hypothetical protein BDA96_10G308600 [Sorghum bicolor]KAG0517928.1 hypothetical protein BDA96_09G131300 [Sorghum bicolor]KAG0524751.1 hypothetical protein BDA96_07G238600 [Sorghum bicolor]OQU77933.1 hypothetical protein SORBI_3009G124850 [Sorghum bicolor]